MRTLRERLAEWTDWDVAEDHLGIVLGLHGIGGQRLAQGGIGLTGLVELELQPLQPLPLVGKDSSGGLLGQQDLPFPLKYLSIPCHGTASEPLDASDILRILHVPG